MTQAFNLSQLANRVNTTGQLNIATGATGTLPIANGGTNNGSLAVTAGTVVVANGSQLITTAQGTTGQVLQSNGTGTPTWGLAGGITLLGTLNTTSGTTQILSSLSLSQYSQLFISIIGVSHSNTSQTVSLRLASLQMSSPFSNTNFLYGIILVDLQNNGCFTASLSDTPTLGTNSGQVGSAARAGQSGITGTTTSLTFDFSVASSFDSGTIKVYGTK